jgi:ketosteroid isomerase-like protein
MIQLRQAFVTLSIGFVFTEVVMKLFLIVLMALTFSPVALGQSRNDSATRISDDELVLRDMTIRWLEADAKGDAATVVSLLADEFSFLGGNNRAQYLASMNPDPALVFETAVIEDQKVQIYGDTAVVTGINTYRFKKEGRPLLAKFPSMTVWVKKNGRWQCVKAATLAAVTN